MAELLLFPDVEALVIDILNTALQTHAQGVKAGTKVPRTTGGELSVTEYVRIVRAGGPAETLISENAYIIVETYAEKETRAVFLVNLVRAIFHAQDGQLFGASEISGVNNLPDPTTSKVRYTQTFGIRARATAL